MDGPHGKRQDEEEVIEVEVDEKDDGEKAAGAEVDMEEDAHDGDPAAQRPRIAPGTRESPHPQNGNFTKSRTSPRRDARRKSLPQKNAR